MRHIPRIDANQPEIVAALRSVGASVQSLAMVGKGCPDLLVGYLGANYCFEVKDGAKPLSRRALTPDEQKWCERWAGQVETVECVSDALRAIGCEVWRDRAVEEVLGK